MTAAEHDAAQRFVRQWKVSGPALDAIKWKELRAMNDQEARHQSEAVMAVAGRWIEQNPGVTRPSGMLEQQRVFARWWTNRK